MEKFIPYEKLSKKKRRELDKKRRSDWGELRPVTRKIESGKIYKRKKAKPEDPDFAFFIFWPQLSGRVVAEPSRSIFPQTLATRFAIVFDDSDIMIRRASISRS